MGDDSIVAASVMLDKAMQAAGRRGAVRARVGDAAAVLTGRVLHSGHHLSGPLRASRFNRRPPPMPTPESTGFRG